METNNMATENIETNRDYESIERPYNTYLERSIPYKSANEMAGGGGYEEEGTIKNVTSTDIAPSTGGATDNGSVQTQPVKNDGGMGDVWIKNFIRSQNWKPKKVGFSIDGQTGKAEFTGVYVSGDIQALTGTIGGFTITETELYGGIIKTAATVGSGSTGVIVDTDGLRGYDSVLGNTFNLPTDGSAPTFSSGIINSTIFEINTSAVLRTASTVGDGTANSAGILINNTGFYACEANQALASANVKILIDGTASFSGTINATAGKFGTSTNYWSVGSTGLTAVSASTDVVIKYGKTDFGQDSTDGFIIGYDYSASKAKIEFGDSDTSLFKYDGTNFTLTDGIITGGTIQTVAAGYRLVMSGANSSFEFRSGATLLSELKARVTPDSGVAGATFQHGTGVTGIEITGSGEGLGSRTVSTFTSNSGYFRVIDGDTGADSISTNIEASMANILPGGSNTLGDSSNLWSQIRATDLYIVNIVGDPSGGGNDYVTFNDPFILRNLPAASEPSGVNGMMYYDITNNRIRAYVGGAWVTVDVT